MRRVLLPIAEFTTRQLAGNDPIVNGSGCLTWHSVFETTGSASAAYRLNDGLNSANQELMHVTLSAGQSTRDYIGIHALSFLNGLYFVDASGAMSGSFHAYVDHVCETQLHTEHNFYKHMEEIWLATLANTVQ